MKKFLAVLLAVGMLATTSVQMAFAGDTVEAGEDRAVSGFVDKDGNNVDDKFFINDYYRVSNGLTGESKKYVERVYIDDDDGMVHIKIKDIVSLTSAKSIKGTITLTETGKDTTSSIRERYTLTLADGDLEVNPPVERRIEEGDSKVFTLPDGYNNGKVKFTTEDNQKIGTLYATLRDPGSYEAVAYYTVRLVEESSKFLNHNYNFDQEIARKYPDANLRFLQWPTAPTFGTTGTLGIVIDSGEYLYQVNSSTKTLSAISGKYNTTRGTFEFSTKTLGSYAISDVKLNVGAAAAPSSSSVAPAPSSTKPVTPPAPVASSKPTPPPASTSAPSSSAEIVPETSSEPPASESSEPESSEPESSEPDSSSTAAEPDEEEDKGGFPLVPIVIGVGVVLVGGVAAFLLLGKKKKSSKNYDSWDD